MRSTVRIISIISIISLLSLLVCCNDRRDVVSALDRAEALLITDPDSSLAILDSMASEKANYSQKLQMRYELLRADAQNKAYVDFTTDSTMLLVADYYDHHGTPNEQMRAHYLLGCTYRDMGEAPKAIECFCNAVDKVDTAQIDCDLYTLHAVYGQMADIYTDLLLVDEEIQALNEAEKIAIKDKDTLSAIMAYKTTLRSYYYKRQYAKVLEISQESKRRFMEYGDTAKAANLLLPAIDILITQNKYSEAEEMMEFYESYSSQFDESGTIKDESILYLYVKGFLELHDNDITKSKNCFYHLVSKGEEEAGYKGLLAVYERLHNADSIAKYARLYADTNDSSYVNENVRVTERIATMHNYSRAQEQAKNAEIAIATAAKYNSFMLIILFVLVTVIYSGYSIFQRKRKSAIKSVNILTLQLALLEKEYAKVNERIHCYEKKIATLSKSTNHLERNYKKKLEVYNTRITELTNEISVYKDAISQSSKSVVLGSFYDTNIYRVFYTNSTGKNGTHVINDSEWEELNSQFHLYFYSFIEKLSSRNALSQTQMKVCMLIYLDFKELEIQNILGVDKQRLNKIKVQINQKIFQIANASTLRMNLKKM